MGWQLDRAVSEAPLPIAWAWFIVAIIWLCVLAWGWGLGKDWGTAMAFGQLLAASASLIVVHTKD